MLADTKPQLRCNYVGTLCFFDEKDTPFSRESAHEMLRSLINKAPAQM
jgi:hypothetical protein